MVNFIEFIIFVLFDIYVFYQALIYGIYEYKKLNNKFGGSVIILFSLMVSILSLIALIMA